MHKYISGRSNTIVHLMATSNLILPRRYAEGTDGPNSETSSQQMGSAADGNGGDADSVSDAIEQHEDTRLMSDMRRSKRLKSLYK